MSKRRIFDIDFPDDSPAPASDAPEQRRGPMAAAISENADALSERQAAEAAIRAENDRLAHEHVRLKKSGLIVDLLPIDAIHMTKLSRDRAMTRDAEIDDLKASIQAIGLSNPIQVEESGDGYELIQGYRRLTAFRELWEETGDPAFAKIPAGLAARGDALEKLYRRMVDENLVRRDISFAEMAELARAYVAAPGTEASDIETAIASLYASSGRQKRHYIRGFCTLLDHTQDFILHPAALPRALGLDLLKRIEQDKTFLTALCKTLAAQPDRTAAEEVTALRTLLAQSPAKKPATKATSAKTTFRVAHPMGLTKCAASNGRIELQLDQDFTAIDRRKLEAAVEAFLQTLSAE